MTAAQENDGLAGTLFWQPELPSRSYVAGLGLIGGVGLGTLWVHLMYLFSRAEPLYTALMGSIIPFGISIVLVVVGLWIHNSGFEDAVFRIGTWCLVGAVVLVGVSVVSITYQQSKGVLIADPLRIMSNHVTVGALLGVVMGIYDGQRRQRGQKLEAEREHARELSDRLTILNRVLRHDIRNKVNVISGNVALLRNGTTEHEQVAETIQTQAQELQTISSRARQLEEVLESDASAVRAIDLGPTLRAKALKLEKAHPDVDVEVDAPGSIEVRAHELIGAAIDELLENAVEHNDADSPRVTIDAVTQSAGAPTTSGEPGVVVRIRDNGPGIPEAEIEVLDRGRETGLKHTSGLGLWLVRWIVALSEGEVAFETAEPRGSVVELRLQS